MGKIKKYIFKKLGGISWNVLKLFNPTSALYGFGNVWSGNWWSDDGLTVFIGCSDTKIRKGELTIPFDITSITFTQELITPKSNSCLWVMPDGLTIVSFGGQYTSTWGAYIHKFSTPFDLTSHISTTFLIDSVRPLGLYWRNNGLEYFTLNEGGTLNKYSVSVAWDYESTRTLIQSEDLGVTLCRGVQFREDGLKMYITNGAFFSGYSLSVAFDITTLSLDSSYDYTIDTTTIQDLWISEKGDWLIGVNQGGSEITKWDWK